MKRFPAWLALGYVALTIAFAYPLSIHPASHVMSQGTDTNLFIWTLAWDTHAFLHQPFSIFDANIFFPFRRTLAYSENLIGSALFAAPVLWLTHNPVLTMNLAALVTAPLCAFGAYCLARSLGISALGASLAGLIYGFSPPRFFRLEQLHLTSVQWLPFSMAFAHRYLDHGRRSDLRWSVVFFTLQALTSGHGAVFLTIALAALIIYRVALGKPIGLARRAHDLGLAEASLLVLLLLPAFLILVPYRTAQLEMGLQRNLQNWHTPWTSFLASPSHVQQYFVANFLPDSHVNETASGYLFPGFVVLLLGAIGILERPGSGVAWRRAAFASTAVAIGSFGAALYSTVAGSFRLRVGSIVLLSARHPWRAWVTCAVAVALRVAITGRAPFRMMRIRLRRDDMAAFYTLLLLVTIWLAIGPPYGVWQYVYWLPGLNFIRVPARFTILGLLALAVLAGFGFERLSAGLPARVQAGLAAALAILLVGEFAAMPLLIAEQRAEIPSVDRWLATRPPPFAIAEVPIFESPIVSIRDGQQSVYMLHSMAHWQKTIHGYSGLLPEFSEDLYARLARFPDASTLQVLSDIGVRFIVVHSGWYRPADWLEVERRISQFPQLRLEHVEPDGRIYSLGR